MTIAPTIYIAGHRGMVGSAIVCQLQGGAVIASEARQSISPIIITRTHAELDLTNQAVVRNFFATEKPSQVYLAAAKVGGIHANNTYPADFIYQNLMVQANVIDAAFQNGVQKLLFLGSSCIYPRQAPQKPMAEMRCSPARWSPPTSPTPLPKLPASSCVKATTANTAPATAWTTGQSCPPICMAPATTATLKTPTSSPH